MNRREINSLSMIKSIVQFFTENLSLISDKPALKAAYEKLKALVAEIEALEQAQIVDTKADTALKSETRATLSAAILKVTAAIAAHAAATSDTRLKMAADITENDLKRLRDNALVVEARSLYETAVEIAPELLVWSITKPDIDAIDTHSASFDAKDPAIKNIKARSVQATADLKTKTDEAVNYLKNTVDAMMLPFKTTAPLAYSHYLKAREVINIAGGHSKAPAPETPQKV